MTILMPARCINAWRMRKQGVEQILQAVPNVRIVLVRIDGLFGSRTSRGYAGEFPNLNRLMPELGLSAGLSGIFGMRRRPVTITFVDDPPDFPRANPNRRDINRYLENFYNNPPMQNDILPITPWEP